jgi:ribosomal protein L37AE/L43A
MVDLPDLEPGESVRETVRSLLPWLPEPHACGECGAYCEQSVEYVATQAEYLPVWVCPECDNRYYRERENGLSADPWR